jgi:hypothetical protein
MKNPYHSKSKRDQTLKNILEAYRREYRTTASGRRVAWDEPGEESDNPDVRRHNAFARSFQSKQDARTRLKQKGKVPTRGGKPIFERAELLNEELNSFLIEFRGLYHSNKTMQFKEWIKVFAKLLDDLG